MPVFDIWRHLAVFHRFYPLIAFLRSLTLFLQESCPSIVVQNDQKKINTVDYWKHNNHGYMKSNVKGGASLA